MTIPSTTTELMAAAAKAAAALDFYALHMMRKELQDLDQTTAEIDAQIAMLTAYLDLIEKIL